LVNDKGRLWQYSAGRGLWESLDKEMLHNMVAGYDGLPVIMGKDANGNIRIGDLRVDFRTAKDASLLLIDKRHNPKFFDDAVEGLAFSDVFLCMQPDGSVSQMPLEASQRSIHGLPFPYEGQDALPTQFISMLQGCFAYDDDRDGKVELMREFIGICLVNKATDFSRALLLLGEGNNGKSAVLNIVEALFSGTLITAIQPSDMNKETNLAELSRARLNLVHELNDREIENSGAIKSLITGNLSYGRDLYGRSFGFLPRSGHMLASNDLPIVRDLSGGFWRRWLVLTFNREFTTKDAIPKLDRRIIESELSLIAAWAIQGASNVVERGRYTDPISSQAALRDWRKGLDQVDEFLTGTCDIVPLVDLDGQRLPHNGVFATKAYTAYQQWVQMSAHKQLTAHRFYRRLLSLKVPKLHVKEGMLYGLKIRLSIPGRR
jgi:putative DNA primase/helicase